MSKNGHYLVWKNGKPFFWLGDTAWLLFQATSREDADLYLRTRAGQGFTVIQAAIVMGEERVGGTLKPNVYGDLAFVDGDPSKPKLTPGKKLGQSEAYDYWDHVDYIVSRAKAHRLMLGLLPEFGADAYKYLTPENAYAYGLFLGKRYGAESHVFWILGGDNTPDSEAKREVWNRLARGISVGTSGSEDYGKTLMSYHINAGASSSQWFHDAPWLDVNMTQVWGDERNIYPAVSRDYGLTPAKPAGLGEGSYEDGPQYPTKPINAWNVRKQAYWSYFAGGYYTYGNTNTWNFGSYKGEATQDWKTALHSPGAAHLTVLARFFNSMKWWDLVPDPSLIAEGRGEGDMLNVTVRSVRGDRILVYLSSPSTVSVRQDGITSAQGAWASWLDPRSGNRLKVEEVPTMGTHAFKTPEGWQDALLLIEARH